MNLINRYEKCVGLTLWRFGQHNVELCNCPSDYEIKPHSHDNEHIELMYIFGRTTFWRHGKDTAKYIKHNNPFVATTYESFSPKWYHIFRKFTVLPKQVHWFKVSNRPLIFVNFARFLDGHKPTSASIDFHPTTTSI